MTAASRRESLAPSLFPFLAVLLCTMGALVLILMLLVAGAETSGKAAVEQIDQEMQWEQDKLQLIKNGLNEKYEEAKIVLEKKRLVLQNYEQHIRELTDELEQLEKTAQQAEAKVDTQKESQEQRDQRRLELEKQLADAKKKLEKKLKDPKGDKPIFAIIPYDGPNGTHRRPIYLECNHKGVVVQPEGVVVGSVDLRPPYGPGNPLDAVLRAIRAEYPATNGAVTSNPYPLLVVRPSGIKHFMMARAAMSGWDDQFGYELISEELELSFPPSVPNLDAKIVKAIEAARERQAALVMAMPQHYSSNQLEDFADSGDGFSNGFSDDAVDFGGGSNSPGGESGSTGSSRSGSSRRGGFAMGGSAANGSDLANKGQGTGSDYSGSGRNGANSNLTMGQAGAFDPNTAQRQGQQDQLGGQSGQGSGAMSFFGSGGSSDDPTSMNSSRNRFGGQQNAGGDLAFDGGSAAGDGSGKVSGVFSGPSDGTSSDSSNSSGGSSGGTGNSNGGGGSGGKFGSQPGSQGSASASGSPSSSNSMASQDGSSQGSSSPGGSSSSINANADPNQAGGMSSLDMNFSKNRNEQAKPIAATRGRDWAWRDGNRSQTAVIRSIRLQCYDDRWVIYPDRGSNVSPIIIQSDKALMKQAERLAEVVSERVDGWGVAVAGGRWAPVLHVDVASNAEMRFQQLQRLMEGSGVDVVRKSTIAPQSATSKPR
jgi:hypothetical protein